MTHLVSRLAARAVSGIDRIDLAYGRHFAERTDATIFGAVCRAQRPHIAPAGMLRQIVERARRHAREQFPFDRDLNFAGLRDWLASENPRHEHLGALAAPRVGLGQRIAAKCWQARCRLGWSNRAVPRDAVYLNSAEHWLEHRQYFAWLAGRPDVQAVFFVHDLLPFDYPEYFRPGYHAIFTRRFATLAQRGTAFIVSTTVVRDKLEKALGAVHLPIVPIHVAALPSPLGLAESSAVAREMPARPYFLLVSTIEPRKNHLLILNIWRELAARLGDATPRLVLVGSHGWEDEQILDMLDRCEAIAPHVVRSARLSRQALALLVASAQAVLMPSFDEGYGLPLVEALGLGTPVIASDIATFREVAHGHALLLSPLDGIAWQNAVVALASRESPAWQAAKAKAESFRAPDWDGYFRGVDEFLNSL